MKKIIFCLALSFGSLFTYSQTEFDALRFSQSDIIGTAKYMSMGGAMGALGGDASAIKDNPAGLGVYSKSQVSTTFAAMLQNTASNWNNTKSVDQLFNVGFNNFSFVIAKPTKRSLEGKNGLLNSNFSFSYNRTKDYSRNLNLLNDTSLSSMADFIGVITAKIPKSNLEFLNGNDPFITPNNPWVSILGNKGNLITENPVSGTWESSLQPNETVAPSFDLIEKGFIDKFTLSWAGNINNILYLGATANLNNINYSAISYYAETFEKGGSMCLMDTIYTKGSGVNFNIGAIIKPLKFLQIGLSINTPTVYLLKDNFYSHLDYVRIDSGSVLSPGVQKGFKLQNPLELNASAAFIIGKKATITVDYNYSNTTGTRLKDLKNDKLAYDIENARMNEMLKDIHTLKFGAEFNFNEKLSARAGYALVTDGTKPTAVKNMRFNSKRADVEYFLQNSTNYLSFGVGYQLNNFSFDFAFLNKSTNETYYPYSQKDIVFEVYSAEVKTSNNLLVVTVGYKF